MITNHKEQIIKNLIALYAIFVGMFTVFVLVTIIFASIFLKEIAAFDKCMKLTDPQFTACYSAAKR